MEGLGTLNFNFNRTVYTCLFFIVSNTFAMSASVLRQDTSVEDNAGVAGVGASHAAPEVKTSAPVADEDFCRVMEDDGFGPSIILAMLGAGAAKGLIKATAKSQGYEVDFKTITRASCVPPTDTSVSWHAGFILKLECTVKKAVETPSTAALAADAQVLTQVAQFEADADSDAVRTSAWVPVQPDADAERSEILKIAASSGISESKLC
jgi:hypothetical protein